MRWLGFFAFIEAIIFPIPADIPLVAYCLLNRAKVWVAAAVTTLCSVLGGIGGYLLGYFLLAAVRPWLGWFGGEAAFEGLTVLYGQYGAWLVAVGGFTFVPYKLVTIASGAMGLNIFVFAAVSLASRGLRYFLVAWLASVAPALAERMPNRYQLTAQAAFFAFLGLAAWLIYR